VAVTARAFRDRENENQVDISLVRRVLAGDTAAKAELKHKYLFQFASWIRRWVPHSRWVDDYAGAAVDELFKEAGSYNPGLASFRTWARRVAYTKVIKCIRDWQTERCDDSLDDEGAEEMPCLLGPEDDHVTIRVREEIAKLPYERMAAVAWRLYYGMTDRQIAARLHIPKRKVSYRRKQGYRTLKRTLGEFADLWI